jgi:hypothetical protein
LAGGSAAGKRIVFRGTCHIPNISDAARLRISWDFFDTALAIGEITGKMIPPLRVVPFERI